MNDCKVPTVIRDEIKGFVKKRKRELTKATKGPIGPIAEEMLEVYEGIEENIGKLNVCEIRKSKASGSKKKRKPTARNVFIGHCMRKPENGGMGKDMASCSAEYKEKGEKILDEYDLREVYHKKLEES